MTDINTTQTHTDDALNDAQVKQIAHLARIAIDQNDLQGYTQDLNRILHLMDKLGDINTDGITPMASPHAVDQPLRRDDAHFNIDQKALMVNAPDSEKGLFKVPQVIE